MALWGKTDALVSAPKWVARKATFNSASTSVVDATANTINLIPSNTGFNTGDAVYYSINGGTVIGGLTDATTYYVRVVGAGIIELYNTYANATAGSGTTGRLDISGVGVGSQTLQRTGAANPYGDHIYNGQALVFADVQEAQQVENRAKGIKGPGWWLYSTGTNGSDSSVYHHAECLIALGGQSDKLQATTGDQADDAIVLDATVSITAQPTNTSVVEPATASFSVTAAITGAGSLTYQWQVQEGGAGAWANVSRGTGGTTASYTTGATQVAASGSADSNGDKYRCVVGASTGNTDVTSNPVTLTVTAAP